MSDWSPVKVEEAIHSCAKRIADGVLKCDKAYRLFLAADQAYDIAYAEAYLAASGPQQEKKFSAEIDPKVVVAREARDTADAAYRLMDRNMRAIQSELDALRSIGTSVRQAYQVAGRGEY